jgi:DNA primase
VITQTTIQQILDRIDVLDVVGGFVKLKKRGANYLGLCPFHDERTPSFTVSPSKRDFQMFWLRQKRQQHFVFDGARKVQLRGGLAWLAQRYNMRLRNRCIT